MIACPPLDQLRRLLADELSDEERVVAGQHVEGCPACRESLAGMDGDEIVIPTEWLEREVGATSSCPRFLRELARHPPVVGDEPSPEVPGFEILGKLGGGGMGLVYRARDLTLDWIVAIKMPRQAALDDPYARKRFEREARVLAQLRHPHIVPVHRADLVNGQPYFVMDYVSGGSLAGQITRFTSDPVAAAGLVLKIAQAVDHAHRQGVLHRDIKPSNIFLDDRGEPLVGDFGVAGLLDGAGLVPEVESVRDTPVVQETVTEPRLTRTGTALGTPAYMAPEQGAVGPVDRPADIWALGVILYELLTGQAPFRATTREEVMKQILEHDPVAPRALRPGLDPELEAVCLKCLEKMPSDRYASAQELADDLGRWLRRQPTVARPRSRPARIRRALRRHWIVTTAAVFFVAATVATVIAARQLDPNRPLKEITRELAAGRSVELIGETGPPRWFRWSTEDSEAKVAEAPDGTFSVQSWKIGLLELVPDPQWDRYRFSVEVRQDQTALQNGQVGIYCLHSKQVDSSSQPVHCYFGLEYIELNNETGPRSVTFFSERYCQIGFSNPQARLLHASLEIPAAQASDTGRWRKLSVEVTPERISTAWAAGTIGGAWATKHVGTLTYDQLRREEARVASFEPLTPMQLVNPAFAPREALGLFVNRATGSFRRALLEPIVDPN